MFKKKEMLPAQLQCGKYLKGNNAIQIKGPKIEIQSITELNTYVYNSTSYFCITDMQYYQSQKYSYPIV